MEKRGRSAAESKTSLSKEHPAMTIWNRYRGYIVLYSDDTESPVRKIPSRNDRLEPRIRHLCKWSHDQGAASCGASGENIC